MKRNCIFLILTLVVSINSSIFAATITSQAAGGDWSLGTTWIGGVTPGPLDDVIINNNSTVVLDGNFTCNSLNILAGNQNSTLEFNGFELTVNGIVTIGNPTANNRNKRLYVDDGILNCNAITMTTSTGNTRDCIIRIGTGTVNVFGSISMPSALVRHHIDFTGNGTLNVQGDVSPAGGFNTFAGCTVNYNGAGNQVCGGAYTYANVIFTGGGTKTVSGVTTINEQLTIQDNATLSLSVDLVLNQDLIVQNNGILTTSNDIQFNGDVNLNDFSRLVATGANDFDVFGDWNNFSTHPDAFEEGNSLVSFLSNSSTQTINNANGLETFYRLNISNTSLFKPALFTNTSIHVVEDFDHSNGFLDLLGFDFSTDGATSANQTFSLSTSGIISSIAGSNVSIVSPGLNLLTVNFSNYFLGEIVSEELDITLTSENSFFENSIFYGPMVVTKTGTAGNDTQGGNIFYGPITFNTIVGGNRWRMGHSNPDIFHNLTINHDGDNNFILGRQSVGNEYYGTTNLNSSTAGGLYLGRNNGTSDNSHEFFGPVNISVTFTGNVNFSESNATVTSTSIFHDLVTLNSTAGSTGNIRFGSIYYGATNFLPGSQMTTGVLDGTTTIQLYRFDYQSVLPIDVITSTTGNIVCGVANAGNFNVFNGQVTFNTPTMTIRNSTFNNDADLSAQNFLFQTSTFNGETIMTKTPGTTTNNANGENIFNGNVTFIHQGDNGWRLGANPAGDDYNADVFYQRVGSGTLELASTNTSTLAGNLSSVGSTNNVLIATTGGGVLEFDGNSNQTIRADIAFTPTFGNLRFNKTGGDVTLNTPIEISSNVDFTSGIVNSDGVNLFIFNDNTSITSISDASFVNGPVRKIGNDAFDFPVGKGGFYRPISISAPGNNSHHFTAEFFNTEADAVDMQDPATIDVAIENISDCEHWILDRTNGASDVNVTLSYRPYGANGCSGVADLASLTIARWDDGIQEWVNHPGTAVGNPSGSITTNTAVTSFSPFALATTSNSNPLPIELVNFTAKANGKQVDLEWQTASEINNEFFTIERSIDGLNFEIVTIIEGAGNSTALLDYKTVDTNPYTGTSFYRLKQTDFDGAFEYSEVRRVEIEGEGQVFIYPNPVLGGDERFIVDVSGFQSGVDQVIILDALGKIVYSNSENLRGLIDIETSILNSGIYFVRVVVGTKVFNTKVVIN